MRSIKSICVVSPGYPTEYDADYPFVEQLCIAFAKQGVNVKVICPQSITSAIIHKKKLHPLYRNNSIPGSGKLEIYQPLFISLPDRFSRFNIWSKFLAARFLKKYYSECDVCYCHFWSSSVLANYLFGSLETKMFVATGESDIKRLLGKSLAEVKKIKKIKGVIAVSTKNLEESVSLGLIEKEVAEVFPNSVDCSLFHKIDKSSSRKKLGLPQNAFIVTFVGGFIERKGVLRLAEALSGIEGVYSIFIGAGNQDPVCHNILHKGPVPHGQIPLYLNASDLFVLPTLKEGCCNSIIEAMACGVPVVSSNLSFNWDVLNDNNSLLVDPTDVNDIRNAIVLMRDNEKERTRLAQGALETAKSLTIDSRASKILEFINSKLVE